MQIETEKVWTPTHEQLIAMGFEQYEDEEDNEWYELYIEQQDQAILFYPEKNIFELDSFMNFYPRSEEAMIEIVHSFTPPNIFVTK